MRIDGGHAAGLGYAGALYRRGRIQPTGRKTRPFTEGSRNANMLQSLVLANYIAEVCMAADEATAQAWCRNCTCSAAAFRWMRKPSR